MCADDIDVDIKSLDSEVLEKRYRHFLSSVLNSIAGKVVMSWNVVWMWWVNTMLRDKIALKSDSWIYQQIDLVVDGEIVWKEKFKETQEEVDIAFQEYKAITWDNENPFKSLQELKLHSTYESDYMNKQSFDIGTLVFNKDKLGVIIPKETKKTLRMEVNGKIFKLDIYSDDFDSNIYTYTYLGSDIWAGTGWDFTDATWLDKDGKLFARCSSNEMTYKDLLDIIVAMYENLKITYFKNSLGYENNLLWNAMSTEINSRVKEPTIRLLRKLVYIWYVGTGKKRKRSNVLWWNTNNHSKEVLKEDLVELVNRWIAELDDKQKKEFGGFEIKEKNWKIEYWNNKALARNDDSVISTWIAYQMYLQYNKVLWTTRN